MSAKEKPRKGWLTLETVASAEDLHAAALQEKQVARLEIRSGYESTITKAVATGFSAFPALEEIELWCKVERDAINQIVALPNLKRFVCMFGIVDPGKLHGFETAQALESFHCDYDLSAQDFLEIVRAPALRILRAQYSKPTVQSMDSVLANGALQSLDLEGSRFDDAMAERIGSSTTIVELEIGASEITAKGLKHISKMQQLCKLDVWATDINMDDLDCLQDLSKLEYLSVGSASLKAKFAGEKLIEKLNAIPSLKRLWLDGVDLNEAQLAELNERYENVFATPPE